MVKIGSWRRGAVGLGGLALLLLLLLEGVGAVEGSLLARAAVMGLGSERNAESSMFCCALLSLQLGTKVSYPFSSHYKSQSQSYWSLQESLMTPTCRLTPTQPSDISLALRTLSKHHCSFAVRGGGHMAWAGAANIQDGIAIDMSAISSVEMDKGAGTVKVGAGARWDGVYDVLDGQGLGVSGGRVAGVGVAGIVIGGVLKLLLLPPWRSMKKGGRGNGNANLTHHPDLFRALKGGSNNFGILTSITLRTFPQGPIWGGLIINPISTAPKQVLALQEFVSASASDPYASVLNVYMHTQGTDLVLSSLVHTGGEVNADSLKAFAAIGPQLMNSMRVTRIGDIARELAAGAPNGMRQIFGTATFGNSAALFTSILNITDTVFAPLRNVSDLQYTTVFQPVTTAMTSKSAATGGNSMGLDPSMGNLVCTSSSFLERSPNTTPPLTRTLPFQNIVLDINIQWPLAEHDQLITNLIHTAVSQINALAKSMDLFNDYIYLNYAFQDQDPIASYGEGNLEELRRVSREVDPEGVFQRLVKGGFKLWREEEGEYLGEAEL
ncbi:hypothetical protein FGG08_004852 [Glutinoglossum americanum]|uniref:FAD-binding PCMH-type domain-containing protein n=1 Tax=Glutinoglossum americanum TaxID=1670608 RepID=A0A9P8I1H6_9PEZI|nr:hypothetical protein FGG08_004852 [Glutinoglossum americanum]